MTMKYRAIALAACALVFGHSAWAGEAEAKKWVDNEFQPSTLSKDKQMAEMKWFIEAAKKLQAKGVKEISVVSETITTHEYESKTLAKAFTEITGITVKHDLIQEGDVVEKLQTSMQSGKSIYDGWISDSDLIGTHYRYGKKDPSLGWRFTDAWLSMAGTADIGIPNGRPVDEWGIRASADGCNPQGASVARGGATNSPAAVYALTKYVDWMKKYSPKEAIGMTFGEAGPVPAQGQIAQQIFWYTAFTADMTKPGLPVVNADGTPKWRMAPGPNGPYWKQGMQNGYQDVGSWTFFKDHDANKTAAAWLYAQFVTAKTTSLKKTIVGLTPIRESDIRSEAMTKMAPKLGGLVEFYRSPARVAWTPTGTNVPDYPKLAQLWWKNVAVAVTGEKTPQQAMDNLANEMDDVMARLERAGMARCAPKLNPKGDPAKYLSDKAAPWAKLANEKPKGETIAYEKLLNAWKEGRVR